MELGANTIRWKIRYFDTFDSDQLATLIPQRIRQKHLHSEDYGMFAAYTRLLTGGHSKRSNGNEPQ
jgi:hypothetical protein